MASYNKQRSLRICCVIVWFAVVNLVNSQLVNIARDKPADMSSVSEGSSPEFAVDGNKTADSTCSLTNSSSEGDQWWRLDLTESLLVRQIYIHLTSQYQQDSFPDTQVYITGVPEVPDETNDPCEVITGSENTTDSPDVIKIECDMEGQYIFIVRRDNITELSTPQLILCEVSVLVCVDGMYGPNCSLTCGQCSGTVCHPVSGLCPGACRDGYTGTQCTSECQNGYYGPNCSLTCGQCGISGCDHVTGSCNGGCKNGYTGNKCDTALTTDSGLSALAAGGIGAAIAFVVTIIIVGVIILIICCCMEQEKKVESDLPKAGVNAVRYGRKNVGYEGDEDNNSTSSADRNHPYEQLDAPRYVTTTPVSTDGVIPSVVITQEDDGVIPSVVLTPSDDGENTSSTDPQYLFMSGANQHIYEAMDGQVTHSDLGPDDVVDPEALELPEPSLLEKSLGGNSYITMSELNTYENTQM